ncbi:MAG: PilN domain-containing protein [Phycisphaerae bacterium]|nr:PilN domain-containing protein [Phycisphaerae bacterium]
MKALNLIPRAYLVRRARRRRGRAWAIGLAAYTGAAGLGSVAASIVSAGPQGATAEMVAEAESQASMTKRDIGRATREAADWSRRAEAERAIGEHPRWSVLLGMLARLRGESVVLSTVEVQPPSTAGGAVGGYRLALEGVARSQPAVTRYVLDLEGSGVFDRVTLTETRATEFRGEPSAGFRIDCVLGQADAKRGGSK